MVKPYDRRHLFVRKPPAAEKFTSVQSGGSQRKPRAHPREQHGQQLLQQFAAAVGPGDAVETSVRVEFQSEPGFDLALKSLDSPDHGLELLSVREHDKITYATVLINRSGVERFRRLVADYMTQSTPTGGPRNGALVDSVAKIRRALLESLWTEVEAPVPPAMREAWFEVWLRKADLDLQAFRARARAHALQVADRTLEFIDRAVILVGGRTDNLAALNAEDTTIAEVRLAKLTALDFTALPNKDRGDWANDLAHRLVPAPPEAPAVCVLDTGVNRGHVLLQTGISSTDVLTCNPAWGTQDHMGHGTEMAGLALHGDLAPLLGGRGAVQLTHKIESVKILPPVGQSAPEVWGAITTEGISRAEVQAPGRARVSCLAVTADARDRGEPSSWSGALDQFTSGADDGERRLICVSAGNMRLEDFADYPDANLTASVQDPAQSWNALTVGAVADRDVLQEASHQGWTALASVGDLCPATTTSLGWNDSWPIKPDIVMSGGNAAIDPGGTQVELLDSLRLLSTYHQPLVRQFTTTGDTSAAAALASRFAATVQSRYPRLWPETVRALIVQSAEWTPAMERRFPGKQRPDIKNKLRCFGFGVPDLQTALASASNDTTLIIEQELQPFDKRVSKGSTQYVTRDMHLYSLPWPEEVLRGLGETDVELRVTLSYFIEPSPGRRGWKYRHRYPSFGLRFDMKTGSETSNEFRARINAAARADDVASTESDSEKWVVGPTLRARGSIHSDRWIGSATELADKGAIAVYPSIGWWRERPQLDRWDKRTRYSLVISLRAPAIDTDLYTPIANQIDLPVQISIPTRF